MAELSTPTSSCCAPEAQAACCEPSEKEACCSTGADGDSCGCSAGVENDATPEPDIRETVRDRYAAAARAIAETESTSCSCGPVSTVDSSGTQVFGSTLYEGSETEGATATAVQGFSRVRRPDGGRRPARG